MRASFLAGFLVLFSFALLILAFCDFPNDDEYTVREYFEDVDEASVLPPELATAYAGAEDEGLSRESLQTFASGIGEYHQALNAIHPPDEARREHERFVGAIGDVANALERGSKQQGPAAALAIVLPTFGPLRAACDALQDLAQRYAVGTSLGCRQIIDLLPREA